MTKNEELLKSIRTQISNIADDLDHMRSKLEDLVEELDGVTSDIDEMIPDDEDCDDDCDNCQPLSDEEMDAIVKTSVRIVRDILDQIGDHE